jgi:hypothetical protein
LGEKRLESALQPISVVLQEVADQMARIEKEVGRSKTSFGVMQR